MRYEKVTTGTFISRPNRFIAMVEIDGVVHKCHVKNTGRTHEFLRSRTFRRWCVDIPVLWVDRMLPLEEQVRKAEEFIGQENSCSVSLSSSGEM